MSVCKICSEEMELKKETVEGWVCTKGDHGGKGPKVGSSILACPLQKGAIWVHVVDENGDDVPDGIVARVDKQLKTTEAGFAAWDPLPEDRYELELVNIPAKFHPLSQNKAEGVQVRKGQITSVEFALERTVEMAVVVRVGESVLSIEDMDVDFARAASEHSGKGKTSKDTGTSFKDLRKGQHTVNLTLTDKQKEKYWLDGDASQTKHISHGVDNTVTFTLREITFLETFFHIQVQDGKALKELTGAKVKIKAPEKEEATELKEAKAVAKFSVPVTSRTPPTSVDVLALTPDTTDAVYEVIEVVTT